MDLLNEISWGATHWHWWVLAMVLLGVEVFAPGFFFLWFGIAAGVVGLILLIDAEISWQIQVILYALLSVASIFAWGYWFQDSLAPPTDQPKLNRRTARYIGRVFTLEQPIVNARGRIRVDDSWWPVAGSDLPAGAVVRVVDAEGLTLRVEPVNPPPREMTSPLD